MKQLRQTQRNNIIINSAYNRLRLIVRTNVSKKFEAGLMKKYRVGLSGGGIDENHHIS